MPTVKDWFSAHKDGLRQVHERLVERRGFGILGGELYQNVMDTDATHCLFAVHKVAGRPAVELMVEDDGHGFHNLEDAWTMFAPSEKKADPTKAGRFNFGEKVVLSFARKASIHTTSGTVVFDDYGRSMYPRRKRDKGTVFQAELRCTQEQYEEFIAYLGRIIVRPNLVLTINGREVKHRKPIHSFTITLPTEQGEGLRLTNRKTKVEVYEPLEGELPSIYELGIPVVETGDRWHYNVTQKVPLNVDRDNVTPSYLRTLRVAVLNEMHEVLSGDDTETTWVNEATSDKRCTNEAVEAFRVQKYGADSVVADPSNPEANAEAVAHKRPLIHSRGLTPGQRENLYRAQTLISSSKAYPTAGKGAYSDDPNAPPVKVIPPEKWSAGMAQIQQYTEALAFRLMGVRVQVRFVSCNKFGGGNRWGACYGRGHLSGTSWFDYNVFTLGRAWFDNGVNEEVDKLILHEFGHQFESNHLDHDYHNALCALGAKLKREVLADPKWFRQFSPKETKE